MSKSGYTAAVGAAVALVGATAKTVLSVICPAQFGADVQGYEIGFDGVTSTDKAVVVELVAYTADGTGTAGTINQVYGRTITAGFTSKYNYTVEPTGGTVISRKSLTPIGGLIVWQFPYGQTPDTPVSAILGMRLTAPTSAVNANATLWVERG